MMTTGRLIINFIDIFNDKIKSILIKMMIKLLKKVTCTWIFRATRSKAFPSSSKNRLFLAESSTNL